MSNQTADQLSSWMEVQMTRGPILDTS